MCQIFYSVDVPFTVSYFHLKSWKLVQKVQNLKTGPEIEPSSFDPRDYIIVSECLPDISSQHYGLSDRKQASQNIDSSSVFPSTSLYLNLNQNFFHEKLIMRMPGTIFSLFWEMFQVLL